MRLACKLDEILHKVSVFQADKVLILVKNGSKGAYGKQVSAFYLLIDDSDAELDEGLILVCLHAKDGNSFDLA